MWLAQGHRLVEHRTVQILLTLLCADVSGRGWSDWSFPCPQRPAQVPAQRREVCSEWCGWVNQSTSSLSLPSPSSGPGRGWRLLSQWGGMTLSGVLTAAPKAPPLPRLSPSDSLWGLPSPPGLRSWRLIPPAWGLGYTHPLYLNTTIPWQPSPPPTHRPRQPHHVHDGQHVALDIWLPVVLHHFSISYHQGLHPLLFADRALV